MKGITPISYALRGRLNIPVPSALPKRPKIAPRREPALIDPQYLRMHFFCYKFY